MEFVKSDKKLVTEQHLEQIVKKIDEWNKQKYENIMYIELRIPSPFLCSVNIELVDLPGFVSTVDETKDESALINDTISVYLNTENQQRPLLDAIIFLISEREVPDSVFLDLYRCGYFSTPALFLPKLIYLVNSLEGLENVEEYKTEHKKPENYQAQARDEVKRALSNFIAQPQNSEFGIDPDTVNRICERAAATPFFRSTFKGFNTAMELEKALMEVRFHNLRCNMLQFIKELANDIVIAKLKVISATKKKRKETEKEEKKLLDLWKGAANNKIVHEKFCQKLIEEVDEKTNSISPKEFFDNKQPVDDMRPTLMPKSRLKE